MTLTRTIRSLILNGYGLSLHCPCGRYSNLSTADLRSLPFALPVHELVARLTCKKCARRGTVEARLSTEHAPFSPGFNLAPSDGEEPPCPPPTPRCHARSKRTKQPCRNPAIEGWRVCRMHGAGGGAPKGNQNALKHGRYSAQSITERDTLSAVLRLTREVTQSA